MDDALIEAAIAWSVTTGTPLTDTRRLLHGSRGGARSTRMSDRKINPYPEHRRGLWSVRAVPWLRKENWPEGDFGDRWRAVKAKQRTATPAGAGQGREP